MKPNRLRFLSCLAPLGLSLCCSGLYAGEAGVLERYEARLSEQDHLNSKGERLKSMAEIIRQDRANFHKFGKRDAEDQDDQFFKSPENRAAMEALIKKDSAEPSTVDAILNGTPLVRIVVVQAADGSSFVNVWLLE